MAVLCPTCKSPDTTSTITGGQCYTCGALFDHGGSAIQPGPTASTRAVYESALKPKVTVVGGNFADLQRSATSPPSPTVMTQAERDQARGERTTENPTAEPPGTSDV
jgi:hypothetical protein